MIRTLRFVRNHWLTLALFIGSVVLVRWIVATQRAPGAMTIVEAQAMDMTAMKAPEGVFPVEVEKASYRVLGGVLNLPATVSPLQEEVVVARIPGRVLRTFVYPGDRVSPGRVLAVLEASELSGNVSAASGMASAKEASASAAEGALSARRSEAEAARTLVAAAQAASSRAEAELEVAEAEHTRAAQSVRVIEAELAERLADLTYAEQALSREARLHEAGAISLDELQQARRARDAAAARVRSTEAALEAAKKDVRIAERRTVAARALAKEAQFSVEQARAQLSAAQAAVREAEYLVRSTRAEAGAARSEARSAQVVADYRTLRALHSGVVTERVAAPGTVVMPGEPVVRIAGIEKVRVQADVPQALSSRLKVGSAVEVIGPKRGVSARVTSVFPSADPLTRTVRIEALVPNPGFELLPGMFVRLRLATGPQRRVLAVSLAAVRTDPDGGHYVWIPRERKETSGTTDWICTMHPEISMSGPGTCPKCKMDLVPRERRGKFEAVRRTVAIGESDGEYVEILSGLSESELVIVKGFEDLFEGAGIEWKEIREATAPPVHLEHDTSGQPLPSDIEKREHAKPRQEKPQPTRPALPTKKVPQQPTKPSVELYLCPMHPEVRSSKPGTCPDCKMDLVRGDAGSE